MERSNLRGQAFLTLLCVFAGFAAGAQGDLQRSFISPQDSARPWVYWFVMDGNLTRDGITADLESMRSAGIGGAIYMEVGIGIKRGPVEFMSPEWREMIGHAMSEADRLGLQLAMAAGPGWCGTGGPWIKPEQSMQHLVSSETTAAGPAKFDSVLPRPKPRTPFFGDGTLTPELRKEWKGFYRDVMVLAFPTPSGEARLADVDEKALYYRAPYSSQPGVKPFLTAPANCAEMPAEQCIASDKVVDLSGKLGSDGRLVWDVPPGKWTIMRFGRTITGQTTRPAPAPGLGLESDKFSKDAIDAHFDAFVESLFKTTGAPKNPGRGLTTLHFDSWEMGSQNWSVAFREEFTKRRGYDPSRFLPAMSGRIVDSVEVSERFLWDLRQTAQESIVENHALRLKELAKKHGLAFSIEPYDLNPACDLKLGSAADVPMAEFWSRNWSFPTEYSCIEAASLGHTLGKQIVAAESFTALPGEAWQQYPGSMKEQGDWAFCAGINRIVFHRYQAQPWLDRYPGMTMGEYGVHWERTQTWWDMVGAYHLYLSRCQEMLRRGLFVADILYLAPEGAPNVFRPPNSAISGGTQDRLGYNFDACGPDILVERASVKDGRIVFPDGMSYRLLVLPQFDTMTPGLLRRISDLVEEGATIMGAQPRKSPSLTDYPKCDEQVEQLSVNLWGDESGALRRDVGKGHVIRAAARDTDSANPLEHARWIWYPEGNPSAGAPVGKRYFSRDVEIADGRAVQTAKAFMTADNNLELFVNGTRAGSCGNFHVVESMDVTALLKSGRNTLKVIAENGGDAPNPAGVIGAIEIRLDDGSVLYVNTDRDWAASQSEDGAQRAALELGSSDMAPWNLKGLSPWQRDIYPGYEETARVLSEMGVAPDFEADADVRYIHRRDGDADLYFVANRKNETISPICRFRVTGRQPEWWNPVDGECRDLPEFEEKEGRTIVPIRLCPFESGFVVFRKATAQTAETGRNFPEARSALALSSPWEVAFDPKWGGPEEVVFSSLDDWSKRPEAGIKFYSGKAVYRTSFDLAADASKGQWFISLGNVKNIASVNVNGKELGALWCEPWRAKIPGGILRDRGNTLEITVANLWINRLIGDSALPEKKRFTWTTWSPFRPDSPLFESGLLGPVTLCASEGR